MFLKRKKIKLNGSSSGSSSSSSNSSLNSAHYYCVAEIYTTALAKVGIGLGQNLENIEEMQTAADRSIDRLIKLFKMSNQDQFPDCPDSYSCCITADGTCMVDPVFTADGHSYERSAIEKWFQNKSTSPKTGLALDSKALLPNLTLLSQITEWKDDQLKGRADNQSIKMLTADLVNVSTSKVKILQWRP